MKFALLLALFFPLVSSTLSDCEKEFLKNCRSCNLPSVPSDPCPMVGYDCVNVEDEEEYGKFNVTNGRFGRDCDSLRCADPAATLIIDGVPYPSIACSENLWRFGKHYTLNTTSAACIKRCDNCKTFSSGTKTKAAEIVGPTTTSPCASAKCKDGWKLWGKKADKTSQEIDETVTCTGERLWTDGSETKFESVYCKLIVPV